MLLITAFGIPFRLAIAQPDCPTPACPPASAHIYGKAGWYSIGDIIQFVGDSNYTSLSNGGCSGIDWLWGHCTVDAGFTFREVTNFNPDNCSYTPSTTCDVARAPCCSFWGYLGVCDSCSDCCNQCDLCMSFWEVVAFYADGSTGRGCWELAFVSDCTEYTCQGGLGFCDVVRFWDH